MSFGEKVKARLDALEKQVAALDARLNALEDRPAVTPFKEVPKEFWSDTAKLISGEPIKRKPGRPRKIVNG